jgi:hypothetical protein
VVRAELIKGATVLRCSTWRQTAENLAKPRTGLGLHPLSDATGSRDAPKSRAATTKNTTAQPPPDKPKNDHETARPNATAWDIDLASQERAAALAEHVRAVVDSFPPLTPEQRDRIGALLHARGEGETTHRHDKRLAHHEALADALRHGSD